MFIEDCGLLSTKELMAYYEEMYSYYSSLVDDPAHLCEPDIFDALQTGDVRDELYLAKNELVNRNIAVNLQKLRNIDISWQEALLKYIENGKVIAPINLKQGEPSTKWWMQIETLDQLSEHDLSTL